MLALIAMTAFAFPDPGTLFDRIEQQFHAKRAGFLREKIGEGSKPDEIMYNWGLGVTLSAENALARLNSARVPHLVKTLKSSEAYWNPSGPVPGYDASVKPRKESDRYYDDNEWMVMAMVESYQITHDKHWLHRAEDALKYALSGQDDKLGGGIYWRERTRDSKNTCSNGPGAAACLAVYGETHDPALLGKAKSIYDWTYRTLRDPSDGLYWDNIHLNGKVDKMKWSYNSALMLRSARELFKFTQEKRYRDEADALDLACRRHWVRDDGSIDDELPFAHLLFENLDPAHFSMARAMTRLLEGLGENGLFGGHWGRKPGKDSQMLHQASAIRALAIYQIHLLETR